MDSTAAVPAQARRAALERRWWVVCAGVIAGVALGVGGAAALLTQARPVYASTVSVLVQRIGATEVSLPTEAQLARSTQTAADAAKAVGRTAEDIAGATRVTPLADSSVLLITVEGAARARPRRRPARSRRPTWPTGPGRPGRHRRPGPHPELPHRRVEHPAGPAQHPAGQAAGDLARAGHAARLGHHRHRPDHHPQRPGDGARDDPGRPRAGDRRARRGRSAPSARSPGSTWCRCGRAPCSARWPWSGGAGWPAGSAAGSTCRPGPGCRCWRTCRPRSTSDWPARPAGGRSTGSATRSWPPWVPTTG